jgi:thioredoxin reductase
MTNNEHFDIIIIGGSYSGLAAGMSFGRALLHILIIDSGNPCNKQIQICEKEVKGLEHISGYIQNILFGDGTTSPARVIYARVPFEQHCRIPESPGCELTSDGYIKVDPLQETSVHGVFACGDNASRIRTVANAVATGTTAGISASKKIIVETF